MLKSLAYSISCNYDDSISLPIFVVYRYFHVSNIYTDIGLLPYNY